MCLWTAKKSVDACLFAPNESPILRILGMNNRNKITFKMIHLTVDAWRLQWQQSFPQLTSHTCNRPAGFTQEAHGVVYRKRHDPPHKYGFVFCSRTYPCTCTCCPEAGMYCQERLDLCKLCMGDAVTIRNTSFFLQSESVSHSKVNCWFYLLVFWPFGVRND